MAFKYVDLQGWNRVQQLAKLQRIIAKKTTAQDTSRTIWRSLGETENHSNYMMMGVLRERILPKYLNDIIEVVTDSEFSNYYRWDRILNGKVKAFSGANPKERMLSVLEVAKGHHRF